MLQKDRVFSIMYGVVWEKSQPLHQQIHFLTCLSVPRPDYVFTFLPQIKLYNYGFPSNLKKELNSMRIQLKSGTFLPIVRYFLKLTLQPS